MWVLGDFWDAVYRYFFPDWARWLIPLVFGLLFAAVALACWWGAVWLSRQPVADVVFAIFEFMLYGCIILSVTCLLSRIWRWAKHLAQTQAVYERQDYDL